MIEFIKFWTLPAVMFFVMAYGTFAEACEGEPAVYETVNITVTGIK